MKAFKGFDSNFRCRGFQYTVGGTYTHNGGVEVCKSGFHSCEFPFDTFEYYDPATSRFAVVEVSGEIDGSQEKDKIASGVITVVAEVSIAEMISEAVGIIKKNLGETLKQSVTSGDHSVAASTSGHSVAASTSDRSMATNTGYQSVATNTGGWSVATNTGGWSVATNTGGWSVAANTGGWSVAANTGGKSVAANTGYQSAATNTGYQSAATNTGYQSVATNTGNQSVATNTGNRSVAANTGGLSMATNTGGRSVAANTGYQSAATNTGNQSVAITLFGASSSETTAPGSLSIALGVGGRAKSGLGGFILLASYDRDGDLTEVKVGKAGEDIEPDTWYTLGEHGEFVKCPLPI